MKNQDQFILVPGAQRSGSTYLYHLLDSHPAIQMAKPVKPEPKFFLNDKLYRRGKEFYLNKFFCKTEACDLQYFGEKSTSYIEHDFIPSRVKTFFPNAKVLIIIRNPVHRAISNYKFSYMNGIETRGLKEVFLDGISPPMSLGNFSVSPFDYEQRSFYSCFLPAYIEAFRDNLKVVIFEELIASCTVRDDIADFLNIDNSLFQDQKKIERNSSTSVIPNNSNEYLYVEEFLYKRFNQEIDRLEQILSKDLSIWKK